MSASDGSAGDMARLILDVLRDQDTADSNALLVAADSFLRVVRQDDDGLLELSRAMAYAAMDWAVRAGDITALRNRVKAFCLALETIA